MQMELIYHYFAFESNTLSYRISLLDTHLLHVSKLDFIINAFLFPFHIPPQHNLILKSPIQYNYNLLCKNKKIQNDFFIYVFQLIEQK